MGGGVGGSLLALLLQGMLPFVPYESVHGIVQYVFSLVQPLSSSPSFKGVWTAAVACSIAARVLNRFFPLVARLLSAIIGIEGMSASSRWALSLARIVLEVGLALQLYAFVAMHVRKYCSELSDKTSAWLERIRRGIATAALVVRTPMQRVCLALPLTMTCRSCTWVAHCSSPRWCITTVPSCES